MPQGAPGSAPPGGGGLSVDDCALGGSNGLLGKVNFPRLGSSECIPDTSSNDTKFAFVGPFLNLSLIPSPSRSTDWKSSPRSSIAARSISALSPCMTYFARRRRVRHLAETKITHRITSPKTIPTPMLPTTHTHTSGPELGDEIPISPPPSSEG
eukprot:CAMPEP_0118960828 /NCGR_PEP_ID=MMETSP1169-20130426/63836_1 /TAXON_ID=36882 /ORGANISM="Pyramimonas obovata, Strain CCMP722" /LENGTH=153 /DNA_ID=CAMNT_0006908981 /DNA_START=1053 /DNA_END=1511 /DNA_ORIENTATION=+